MPERIVVSFRGIVSVVATGGPNYLTRALAMKKRAEALGATLCAWSASTFSFEFGADELEEAVSLALLAAEEEAVGPDERFCVGISEGLMSNVGESGSLAMLSWGRPLIAAVSLARIAKPGEIMIDPDLPAITRGELLHTGSRIAVDWGGKRARGVILDVQEPWRRIAARSVARLAEPELIGRDAAIGELGTPVGSLGVIRADGGVGGTRLLTEIVQRLGPSRALFVSPVGVSREPFGALRRALSRAVALQTAPILPERLRGTLDRLLAGDGADLWAAAELLDSWMSPEQDRVGVLAIDDAAEVDETTLDAISSAIGVRGGFVALARTDTLAPLPPSLALVHRGPDVTIGALSRQDAERLVSAFTGHAIATDAMQRWARRSGGLPLGVREALADGLASGELSWIGPQASPRRRVAGRGSAKTPRQWIERRIRFLSEGERAVLIALALLGGDASDRMLDALSVGMAGLAARAALADGSLLTSGWVTRPEPGWLKLTSRTAREALYGSLEASTRKTWHLGAADTIAQHGGVLARADAAWHASQGGEKRLAAGLAIDAAKACAAAALDGATAALLAFAHAHDAELAEVARRDAVRTSKGSLPPPPVIHDGPLDGFEEGTPLPIDVSDEPRGRLDTLLDDGIFARFDPVTSSSRAPASDPSSPPPAPNPPRPPLPPPRAPRPHPGAFRARPPAREPARLPSEPPILLEDGDIEPADSMLLTTEAPVVDPGELGARLAEQAKEALVQGNIAALEQLVSQLRVTGEHSELVERMSGFVALGRGLSAEALRKLRTAVENETSPAKRARARLAYGVALAAVGRHDSALLEALDALARARQAGDAQGEHACARFLARVSSAAGQPSAAAAWAKVAKHAATAR